MSSCRAHRRTTFGSSPPRCRSFVTTTDDARSSASHLFSRDFAPTSEIARRFSAGFRAARAGRLGPGTRAGAASRRGGIPRARAFSGRSGISRAVPAALEDASIAASRSKLHSQKRAEISTGDISPGNRPSKRRFGVFFFFFRRSRLRTPADDADLRSVSLLRHPPSPLIPKPETQCLPHPQPPRHPSRNHVSFECWRL